MGRKSLMDIREWTFGITTSKVVLICFKSLPVLKKSNTASLTSCPTIGPATLKKPDEYPSGPDALSSAISNTTCLTSTGVKGNKTELASSSVSKCHAHGLRNRISTTSRRLSPPSRFWKKETNSFTTAYCSIWVTPCSSLICKILLAVLHCAILWKKTMEHWSPPLHPLHFSSLTKHDLL